MASKKHKKNEFSFSSPMWRDILQQIPLDHKDPYAREGKFFIVNAFAFLWGNHIFTMI